MLCYILHSSYSGRYLRLLEADMYNHSNDLVYARCLYTSREDSRRFDTSKSASHRESIDLAIVSIRISLAIEHWQSCTPVVSWIANQSWCSPVSRVRSFSILGNGVLSGNHRLMSRRVWTRPTGCRGFLERHTSPAAGGLCATDIQLR